MDNLGLLWDSGTPSHLLILYMTISNLLIYVTLIIDFILQGYYKFFEKKNTKKMGRIGKKDLASSKIVAPYNIANIVCKNCEFIEACEDH